MGLSHLFQSYLGCLVKKKILELSPRHSGAVGGKGHEPAIFIACLLFEKLLYALEVRGWGRDLKHCRRMKAWQLLLCSVLVSGRQLVHP